ncbi:MAG: SPFH domain-containing protein [Lachnospiraceae bacterium]|nr:SPFH domain-containing protein [Lachnospiraceae bacterium]
MGLFGNQFANVVEWEEYRDDVIFYKWNNKELKKDSKLILRPGQDAVFLYNGRIEGVFTEEGSYTLESDIIPFLSTLKGFKFGFNSGMRAEVLFVNTKEFNMKWGTKQPINIPHQSLPGGIPIRANGSFQFKVSDYPTLIEKVAGVKKIYTTDDVRERVVSVLDQLLLSHILKEGQDMFHLQTYAADISKGVQEDLDMQLMKIGLTVTGFQINTVSYPEEIQDMINKVASQSMVGDMNRYQQMAVADSLQNGKGGAGIASDMVSMQMGMALGQQMVQQMNQNQNTFGAQNPSGQNSAAQAAPSQDAGQTEGPNFCPNCGTKTNGAKFCPNCGTKLR